MSAPAVFDDATIATLYAPHRFADKFYNPWGVELPSFADLLRWRLGKKEKFDKRGPLDVPVVANDGASLKGVAAGGELTWVGHATFAIHDRRDVILTDPHFSARALIPQRKRPPGIPLAAVPSHAFGVLSHSHYDHLDLPTARRLGPGFPWYVPVGLKDWLQKRGVPNVVEMDWWQTIERGRWKITCLPAQHWSNRLSHPRNATLWCSWLLDSGDRRYYFAGDSGYYAGFAEIGRRHGPIDVAMLPIGAYEPRWFMQSQHMSPEEAYRAFHDLGARYLAAMHWGTFDLTDEPVDLAPRVLRQLASGQPDEVAVKIFAVGERWIVPPR
jgi:N-acyl-phosphatidylethanolamine-hydrolysing phospholipase D